MIPLRGLIQSLKGWLGKPVAGPDTDPQLFFGQLFALPNPDPILRQMGRADQVYASILSDPHVLGDVRSIRGNFRSHDYRLVAGDEDDPKAMAALELAEEWMARGRPNALVDWMEVLWQMSAAFMTGHRAHELVWEFVDGHYLPTTVIDRPNRRFKFDVHGDPLLISTGNMLGAPVEPYQFVISRHMPSSDNPYGIAVLSSLFWCWSFKTGGWRYFVKYCERHGLPWPVARYPVGTSEADQDKLGEALETMIESAYVVVPEGVGVELLVPNASGTNLPQEALIDRANREMSKALTGQAMVAELQGTGARAASETALKRQEAIDDSVRDIASLSMGQVLQWITVFNFGEGVPPPTLEFYRHENAGKERAETYEVASRLGARPSKTALLEELGIPEAKDDKDALQAAKPSTSQPGGAVPPRKGPSPAQKVDLAALQGLAGFEFARAAGMTDAEAVELAAEAADQAIEDHMIAPVAAMLARFEADGRSLAEFQAALEDLVGEMDDEGLREVLDRALSYSILRGAATRTA